MISADEEYNFSIFRDNLSVIILSSSPRANKSAVRAKGRKGKKQDNRQDSPAREISEQDVDQIAEFVDVSSAIQTLSGTYSLLITLLVYFHRDFYELLSRSQMFELFGGSI